MLKKIGVTLIEKNKNNIYYVYEWFDVDSGYVFYVGKGKYNRASDLCRRNNLFTTYYSTHQCDFRYIRKNMIEEEAYALEREIILHYKHISQCHCNIDDGGRRGGAMKGELNPMFGVSPKERMDEKTYWQWRENHKKIVGDKNPNYGNKKLSKIYKENKDLAKVKQSRPRSKNGRAKQVLVIDIDQNNIGVFNCVPDAADFLVINGFICKASYGSIYTCISKNKPYKGFYFKRL